MNIMAQEENEKLPQNAQHLLMEIGEKSVLFRLFLLVRDKNWEVYQNLGYSGCDIILVDSTTNNRVKIEVKTRQRLYTTSKRFKNRVQYTITENEYDNCDFVIAFWFEENHYFIVPKEDLDVTSSNGKILYKFIISKDGQGTLNARGQAYLDRWDLIEERMSTPSTKGSE